MSRNGSSQNAFLLSLLQGRMYQDANRWGYLFQSYVLLTMMELHHKEVVSHASKSPPPTFIYCFHLQTSSMCMLERSVFSARYCFVENLHRRCANSLLSCLLLDDFVLMQWCD